MRFAEEVQMRSENAVADGEDHITHPVNAFLLIKGMTSDWLKVVGLMRSNSADDFIRNVSYQRILQKINYPTQVKK